MYLSFCLAATFVAVAQGVQLTISADNGNATSPYAYGLMFEDINNSGDGGVYAELVQNRAFQGSSLYRSNLSSWSPVGDTLLSLQNLSTPLSSALPTSMRVTSSGGPLTGFANTGFWGFPVMSNWTYKGSFWVHGLYNGTININLRSLQNCSWAEASVEVAAVEDIWTQYHYTLCPQDDAPNSNNTLDFTWNDPTNSSLDFNLISLFPPTYKNRENGLRVDLMEAMADLKPKFFRAPGGNNLEGHSSPYWWNWTKSIGPLEDRVGYPDTWGYEITDGLGLIEYMLWAKDLGMEIVLAVWGGLYLDKEVICEDKLQPYIQSALDEIEFLTGDAGTLWGRRRAALGYPEPFEVNFVEVGNEDNLYDGDKSYREYRFQAFYDAIAEKYPHITVIASFYDVAGVNASTPPDGAAGDFHEYALPAQMSKQFNYFDNYTAEHPVLIGEYAVVEYDQPGISKIDYDKGWLSRRAFFPFWYGSVAEAIFLLGAERNSDKIIGAAYAPGFMNLNRFQWIPDLIAYDADPAHTTLSTSYHVIKLFSSTLITENLQMEGAEFGPAFYVAGRNALTGSHILKAAVYNSSAVVPFKVTFQGLETEVEGKLTYLTAPMNASNPVGGNIVKTHTQTVTSSGSGVFEFILPDYSVAVLEIEALDCTNTSEWKAWKDWKADV